MGQPLPLATTRAQRAEPEDVWEGKLAKGALHLVDDSSKESGAFRVTWKPQPDTEIVVDLQVSVPCACCRDLKSDDNLNSIQNG